MLKLLAFIPEPWASLGLALAFFAAWAYGDVTGRGSEKQKQQIAALTTKNNLLVHNQEVSLDIQTKMATTLSELRITGQTQGREVGALIEELRKKPPPPACLLSDAQRMRLRSIRIGR